MPIACSTKESELDVPAIAKEYYKVYQKRKDLNKLLSFYDEHIIFKDIINGDLIKGKESLSKFLDWANPNFSMLDTVSLKIVKQTIDKNEVTTRGYFTEFQWGEIKFEAMHFTSILIFNKQGKIIEQIDWINYPSNLIDYNNRKNANKWIERDGDERMRELENERMKK